MLVARRNRRPPALPPEDLTLWRRLDRCDWSLSAVLTVLHAFRMSRTRLSTSVLLNQANWIFARFNSRHVSKMASLGSLAGCVACPGAKFSKEVAASAVTLTRKS